MKITSRVPLFFKCHISKNCISINKDMGIVYLHITTPYINSITVLPTSFFNFNFQ